MVARYLSYTTFRTRHALTRGDRSLCPPLLGSNRLRVWARGGVSLSRSADSAVIQKKPVVFKKNADHSCNDSRQIQGILQIFGGEGSSKMQIVVYG